MREAAASYGVEPLICDDYLDIEAAIAAAHPDLVLGTQMERHIAKRLGLPCAVISAPMHGAGLSGAPLAADGFEGANVLFDTWVHPLMMGLEEHLLGMFRGDFEFHADAAPSHLGAASAPSVASPAPEQEPEQIRVPGAATWSADAESELRKIPFFVRAKARRNTERYALERSVPVITLETLYDAKAHFSR